MLSKIVFLQIFVYLFLSPFLRNIAGSDIRYLYSISICALCGFLIGNRFLRKRVYFTRVPHNGSISRTSEVTVRWWAVFAMLVYTWAYATRVLQHGLVDRRIGSEAVAALYADIDLPSLITIRVYELLFWPMLVFVSKSWTGIRTEKLLLLFVAFSVGFFFMGAVSSKVAFLTPVVLYAVYFQATPSVHQPLKRLQRWAAASIAAVAITSISIQRLFRGGQTSLWLEYVERTDGLELVSRVFEVRKIPFFGTWDILPFGTYISSFPFIESAVALKALGITSVKAFLLQSELGLSNIDINNSFVTDIFYLSGYPGLFCFSLLYGHTCRWVDKQVVLDRFVSNGIRSALLVSLTLSVMFIEFESMSSPVAVLRRFLAVLPVYFLLQRRSIGSIITTQSLSK